MTRVLRVFLAAVLACALLIFVGFALAFGPLRGLIPSAHAEPEVIVEDTQIVEKLTLEEEVVLLSLGIQGIEERRKANEKLWGRLNIPGTGKVKFIKYGYTAKLGMDGEKVTITEIGEKKYLVSIPEFKFIGHDDVTFELAAESNGPMSWAVPDEDDFEIASDILEDKRNVRHLAEYEGLLRDQAELHYRQIVASVDPEVQLEFDFAE